MKKFIMHSQTAPKITVVAVLDEQTKSMCFSATRCREDESFIKAKGVQIASERIAKGRKCLLMCDNIDMAKVGETFKQNAITLIESLQKNARPLQRGQKRNIKSKATA